MGKSCSIHCHVRNKDGKVVRSKLFESLLSLLPSRKQAKTYYGVAKSEEFLNNERVQKEAKFDENGEITAKSLVKLAKIDVPKEKTLALLNKEIGAGEYTYEEALSKLQKFNKESEYRDDFIATIKLSNKSNKVTLSVVENTTNAQVELNKLVKNMTIQDRLIRALKAAGVSVKFIEYDGDIRGRYSTENIEQAADGCYNLIQIAHGNTSTEAMAEESGHFAIAALGDSVLVQRLKKALTPEAIKQIYDELGKNEELNWREAAGALVGKALLESNEPKNPIKKLAYRIAQMAKRIFYAVKGDNIKAALIDANMAAARIAEGFLSPHFEGTTENALKESETLYSRVNMNKKVYADTVKSLKNLVNDIREVQVDKLSRKLDSIRKTVEGDRTEIISKDWDIDGNIALDGIVSALDYIADLMVEGGEISRLVDKANEAIDDVNFLSNIREYGSVIRQLKAFQKNVTGLYQAIDNAKEALKGDATRTLTDSRGRTYTVNLDEALERLHKLNRSNFSNLDTIEKNFFLKFCETVLGKKSVTLEARLLWNVGSSREKGKGLVRAEAETEITVEQMLEYLQDDLGIKSRLCSSMSNNPDIIGQIVDVAAKHANRVADTMTLDTWNELKQLEEFWSKHLSKKYGENQDVLYERDYDGNFTGNIISDKNWGEWEKALDKKKKEVKEAVMAANPNWSTLTLFERGRLIEKAYSTELRAWHTANSTMNPVTKKYEPNDLYESSAAFDRIKSDAGLYDFYKRWTELKSKLDENLPKGSTSPLRVPQFKGNFANRVKANKERMGKKAAVGMSMRVALTETFCESSEDTDFGSELTYNTEEEERFGLTVNTSERCDRLPLYGINKLQDMRELSTNLFNTTLSYASMAYTYNAMSQIVDSLEIGKDVLKKRQVGSSKGLMTENRRAEKGMSYSHAYQRYVKFVDKQIYSKYYEHKNFGKLSRDKILSSIGMLGAKLFLAGNVFGGLVNTGTGHLEIIKEGFSGEYFTMADLRWAHRHYFDFKSIGSFGEYGSEDKVSTFVRYMNTRGDTKRVFREWKDHDRARNIIGNLCMVPYSAGDHYMQTIGYLAAAHHTKLYTLSGDESTLFDAYEFDGVTMKIKGEYYKSKEGAEDTKILRNILGKVGSLTGSGVTTEEDALLKKYNLDIGSPLIDRDIEKVISSLQFSAVDETIFTNKVREINNRMHGIYNRQDYTGFQSNIYGHILSSMRGWALGQWERIYSENHYSVVLGRSTEGTANTGTKQLVYMFQKYGIKAIGYEMLTFFAPMHSKTQKIFEDAGLSLSQRANMRRLFADNAILALFLLINASLALGDDDKEEDNLWKGRLYYLSYRLWLEQSALRVPGRMLTEKDALLNLTPAGFSAVSDILMLLYEIGGSAVTDETNKDFYYQGKTSRHMKYDPKWIQHVERISPFYKDYFKFAHPYEAIESFKYGQMFRR